MKQQAKKAALAVKSALTPTATAAPKSAAPAVAPEVKSTKPEKTDWKSKSSAFEKQLVETLAKVTALSAEKEELTTKLSSALGEKDFLQQENNKKTSALTLQVKELEEKIGPLQNKANLYDKAQKERGVGKSVAVVSLILAATLFLWWMMPKQTEVNTAFSAVELEKVFAAATAGASQAKLTATASFTEEQKSELVKAIKGAWTDKDIEREALVGYNAVMKAHPPQDNVAFMNGILDLVFAPGGIKVDGGAIVTSINEKTGALSVEFRADPPPVAKK